MSTDSNGYKFIAYQNLAALLVNSIQEMNSRINLSSAPTSTPAIFINQSGNIGLGTTSPWSKLSVDGAITQTNQKACTTGLTTDANGTINGCVASDVNLKTDIITSTYDALQIIAQISPVSYRWKNYSLRDSQIHSGFIAQDIEAVFPTAVTSGGFDEFGDAMKAVDPNAMASLLVKGLQEIDVKLRALAAGFYITDSQGSVIFPTNYDMGVLLNRDTALSFNLNVNGNISAGQFCLNGVCLADWSQLSANFENNNLEVSSGSSFSPEQVFALDDQGYLTMGKIKAEEVKTKRLGMVKGASLKENMIGEGVIEAGLSSTTIVNLSIATSSKIFLSWNDNLAGAQYWICWKEAGKWFDVCLDRVLARSVKFDYWVVDVSEEEESIVVEETSAVESASTEELTEETAEEESAVTEETSAPVETSIEESTEETIVEEAETTEEPAEEPEVVVEEAETEEEMAEEPGVVVEEETTVAE